MRDGAAYKRYEKDLQMKREEEKEKKILKDLAKEDDDEKINTPQKEVVLEAKKVEILMNGNTQKKKQRFSP